MRVRKSPKKNRWEDEDGGSYLLSSDVHAIQFSWAFFKKVPLDGEYQTPRGEKYWQES